MRLLTNLQHIIREQRQQKRSVSALRKIEFIHLACRSTRLAPSYLLPKGEYYRHSLYSTIYYTLKDHAALFADVEPIVLQWREVRKNSGKKVIYAEHAWLPRSTYQLSSKGCNSRSHIKFENDKDYIGLIGGYKSLQKMKRNLRMTFDDARSVETQLVAKPFFLVALQTGNDMNLLHSGTSFAKYYKQDKSTEKLGQAVIDHLESVPSSCRLIFTQHPRDKDRSRFKVRSENRIVYAGQGVRTIDLLRHDNCRGVIAVNSNTLHEALLWDKPAFALGELLAYSASESPLSGELWDFLGKDSQGQSRSRLSEQYLAMLFAYQWTLADFKNPLVLREILRDVDALVPWETRLEYGFTV